MKRPGVLKGAVPVRKTGMFCKFRIRWRRTSPPLHETAALRLSELCDGGGVRSVIRMPKPYAAHPDQPGPLRHSSAQEAFAVLEGLEVRIELALQQDARLAVQLGREALHLAGTLDSPGSVARAESLLGAALYVSAEYAEAEALLVRALGVCDGLADEPGQRRCLSYLGYLTHASGRPAEAIRYFLRLMALAQHSDSPHPDSALQSEDAQLHRSEAHGGLSMVYSDLGDTASSLEHQLKALTLQRQQANPGRLGMALSNISVDYRDLGQLDESARCCHEALEIARAAGDVRTETAALSNLGLTRLAQGRLAEAGPLFARLLELARRAGLTRRVLWGLHGLAELHLACGHPELALPHLHEALSISQESALRTEETDSWLLLGRSQGESSRVEDPQQASSAVISLERALHLAQETRNLQAESRVRLALSGAHEQAAEPVQALAQLRAYLALRDGRESALTEQRAQVLAVRFGAEESRRENERLLAHARQMEENAHQDALTGLMNRRGLGPHLEAALTRAQTLGTPLCLAVLDLDHFKQVNDRHSHQVGDEVLRAAAQLFLAGCRSSDGAGVGRYGGEEFLILLPDTPLEAAAQLLERLRRRVQDHPWDKLHPELTVTVSVGVAQLGVDTPSAEALVAAADACMYVAKSRGRNRVVAA